MRKLLALFAVAAVLTQAFGLSVLCACGHCGVSLALGVEADGGDDHGCCGKADGAADGGDLGLAIAPAAGHHCSHALPEVAATHHPSGGSHLLACPPTVAAEPAIPPSVTAQIEPLPRRAGADRPQRAPPDAARLATVRLLI